MIRNSLIAAALALGAAHLPQDPLPSWNDGPSKRAILAFVTAATREGGSNFVPRDERIAVFDNDGTLWTEQPMYVQAVFTLDRIKALARAHPELLEKPAIKSALNGDHGSEFEPPSELIGILATAQPSLTPEAYQRAVQDWLATAKHPRFGRPYTELVYQPMLELMTYLRANGFKTYIVSGGENDFMRAWAWKVYGVPPEQVIGSIVKVKYELGRESVPALVRLGKTVFVDDHQGKPIAIHEIIGRRPVAAFGNSDGDQQMLEYTGAGSGIGRSSGRRARLMMLVHHDDAEREYSYTRGKCAPSKCSARVGVLDSALDEARARGWTVVSMKNEWKYIYPFEVKAGTARR